MAMASTAAGMAAGATTAEGLAVAGSAALVATVVAAGSAAAAFVAAAAAAGSMAGVGSAAATVGDLAAVAAAGTNTAIPVDTKQHLEHWRSVSRWVLAASFLLVGVIHLRSPDLFLPIVPGWVPYPRETILATGACELAGAAGLLLQRFRRAAGVMLALYAVCVFPANIKHALDHVPIGATHLGWWYHGPRLAFQPVIVWWALFSAGVMDWPFRRRYRARTSNAAIPPRGR